jgi:acyl carrier protein
MKIEQFIIDFVEATDDESANPLNSETIFRELDSWDSLAALSIMAMIDDKYQANLSADEMKSANNLGELFALIKTKH